jgi:fatty acid desaturase
MAAINDPTILRQVNALRATDNTTNWLYLAREYAWVLLVVGLSLAFYEFRAGWGLSWFWNVPVTLVAVTLIGAGQHRLTTLGHEASHYILFRNRMLNELASDLLCMFPVWSTTHQYRLQHLAHHQFPNDPDKDPDVTQMTMSGHRFRFPMSPGKFVWECVVKQGLGLIGLVRYVAVRGLYSALGRGTGPYRYRRRPARFVMPVLLGYFVLLACSMPLVRQTGSVALMAAIPAALYGGAVSFLLLLPAGCFAESIVRPDVPPRWHALLRVTYITGLVLVLAWLTFLTGRPWTVWYLVLWILPLLTSFSFYMLLRQVVQHGNADRERFTNTRIFLVHDAIRFAVFPLGMDYHLPHHLFPLVPHYRLRRLHELLLGCEDYREQATVVEGYFFHRHPPEHATVVELMARDTSKSEEAAGNEQAA